MRIALIICLFSISLSSCLKKIEEAESLNSNIFDPEYAGEQWYTIEDISTITINNDLKVRIEYSISESVVPTVQPTGFSITANCNNYPTEIDSAVLNYKGNYDGVLEYAPDGSSEYCLDLGIYLWKQDSTINRFSDCISL